MSEYDNLPKCGCGGPMERVLCAPAIQAGFISYVSPGTGKLIESRNQQREDLKASNSIINEPGLKTDIARYREETAEKAFSPIAAGVDAAVTALVNSGQIES